MIQALWLIIRIMALTLFVVWLFNADTPVTLGWMDYAVKIHGGVFLGFVFFTIFCIAFASRFVRDISILPRRLRFSAALRRREKLYQHIINGLHAEERGQTELARVVLQRAEKCIDAKAAKPDKDLLSYLKRRVEDVKI